jgi:thioredoxin 2
MRQGLILVGIAVSAIAAVSVVRQLTSGKPGVFSSETYERAVEANRTDGRLLVVKLGADWCPPCREMDKTTFRDGRIEAWVKEHGAAISVDVDAQRSVASDLGIRGIPTTILFHQGQEVARLTGGAGAEALLMWLERGRDVAERQARRARLEAAGLDSTP